MTLFNREDWQGQQEIISNRDILLEADRDQDGAGDIVLVTGGVERGRVKHDGTTTGTIFGGSQTLAQILAGSTDADGNAITNLADPANSQDAATKNYVDTQGFATSADIDTAVAAVHGIAYIVAATDAPTFIKNRADYTCDGTDDDVQIQAAIDAAAGGGRVVLSPGSFTGGQIVVKDRVWLSGYGMHATKYTLKAGANADAIINFVSPDGIVANAEFVSITDLMIDGNKANQTSGRGIFFSNNPAGASATNDADFDPHNRVENVMIYNCFGDGFASSNRSETRLRNVYTYRCDGNGFNPSYDSFLEGCTAAWSGLGGFNLASSSVRLTNCKAFYSGQVTPGSGNGFVLNAHGLVLAGCDAQDNKNVGFSLLGNAVGCAVQGTADSNSTRGAGQPGVDIFGGFNNIVDVTCVERKADGVNSFQIHALRIRNGTVGCQIRVTHSAQGGAVLSTAVDAASTDVDGNNVLVNGAGSTVTPVFAASYTPDPYAATIHRVGNLTANITINAPSNAHVGALLTVVLRQDATGGRTITWNATYLNTPTAVTTANGFTIGRFVYDGTNWIGI